MRPNETFINQPVRSLQTMLRVISRFDNSVSLVIPDGIYGPATMQAVTAFQRNNRLPATGVVNQQTWDKIYEQYEIALSDVKSTDEIEILIERNQIFRIGDSSPYIYLAQSMLIQLSKDHPTITPPPHSGVLDSETANALRQFQLLAGLDPSGELDRTTWKHLSRHFTLNAHHNSPRKHE